MARIVLDLRPGYGLADLAIAFDEGVLSAAFPVATEQEPEPPLATEPAPARIVLDAGHGGTEKGAMVGDLPEKIINLSVTNQVGALLSAMGYEVLYTRQDDETVSLQDRAAFANDHTADLFVCIHSNSFPSNPEISGVETIRPGNYYVLKHTAMPAVLVEMGYMTNEQELALLLDVDYQARLAGGIAAGIVKYLQEGQLS